MKPAFSREKQKEYLITKYELSKTAAKFAEYYNSNFDKVENGRKIYQYYHFLKDENIIKRIPEGQRILEIGCWTGDLLAKLKPSFGVGIDLCEKAISIAKQKYKHENLQFIDGDFLNEKVRELVNNEKFDYIVIINTIGQIHDLNSLFKIFHKYCHSRTRIFIYSYSRLWQPIYSFAEFIGLKFKSPQESWLPPEELKQMFYLSNLQEVRWDLQILFPFKVPIFSKIINGFFAHLPFIENLCLIFGFVARPLLYEDNECKADDSVSCSIIIPCRNEEGHIKMLVERLPELGEKSEYVFVEGNSTDNTEEVIRKIISENPDRNFSFCKQLGKGKGDAVRLGFSKARYEILAILDADISVAPEDLPSMLEILLNKKAEFVNGSRLVYPMEKKAMKYLNLIVNKSFALIFTYLLGQQVRDTLCGTKVLWKRDYEQIINNRTYFGDFDPFGDFDLLFGASKLNLKIIDFPVRYDERTYGDTNISRFRDGWLLLKMVFFAFNKIKTI